MHGGDERIGGLIMTMHCASWPHRTGNADDDVTSLDIRSLIAIRLGVAIERVSDEAHFVDDLGAGWLDFLELMIAVEDRFAVEITEEDADRISDVGDLIRYVENWLAGRPRSVPQSARAAASPSRRAWAPRRNRHAWRMPGGTLAAGR
jgi:acyl carrier protein